MEDHMNFNRQDWEIIMWMNSHNCRLFGHKKYFLNPYCDIFCGMYLKERVAAPPRGWIGITGKTFLE